MPKTIRWTLEKIADGFKKYYAEHGRYPTAHEVDAYPHLPSSKQIQRNFGGLVAIREQLKLKGPTDFTKGEYSRNRAKEVGARAHSTERVVYDLLVGHFGTPFVHREYFFVDDRRSRTDFFIHCKNGNFCVDVFYPKDRKNLIGCLNSKMRTYGQGTVLEFPVIFVMMNEHILAGEIKEILANKINKLRKEQCVMTLRELEEYIKTKTPLKVAT